jgi:catalase
LGAARRDLQEAMLAHFYKIDPDYGTRLAKAIGVPINKSKL